MDDAKDTPVWFVTGAASGFGRAIVEHVAEHSGRVVATARDPARLDDLVAAHPDTVLALPLDVTSAEQSSQAVAQAERRFGRIDVLVNNAGYGLVAAVEAAEDEEVRKLFETHVFGAVALIKAVLPGMRARGRGHIMNFSSVAGIAGMLGTGYYAAVKSAIEGLSESLSQEVAGFGVKVTIVEPGPFRTGFFGHPDRKGRGSLEAYAPMMDAYAQAAAARAPTLPGDPVQAARILFDIALTDDAPLHLPLGGSAYDYAVNVFTARLAEVERWKDVTRSADFPEWLGRSWP